MLSSLVSIEYKYFNNNYSMLLRPLQTGLGGDKRKHDELIEGKNWNKLIYYALYLVWKRRIIRLSPNTVVLRPI